MDDVDHLLGDSWGLPSGHGPDALVTARLWRAMRANQLVLHCQPTVSCLDGEIASAEALVRWRHPRRGLVPPGEWVPVIERSVLRTRFNLQVLALAAAHQADWAAHGLRVPLSVNVTPSVLADEAFVSAVGAMFADRPDHALRLEITERTTAINSPELKANVEQLLGLGFEFLLDDFGAGYSSLHRLANLRVSTLKIDGSLCSDLCHNETHRAIVRSVADLAHALDLEVVCEGVEDHATWGVMQTLGCDRVQGYHIARPMPAESFPDFVAAYRARPPEPQAQESTGRWSRSEDRRPGEDRRGANTRT